MLPGRRQVPSTPNAQGDDMTTDAGRAGERFLVTGALCCIGAWTVRQLVHEGAAVVAFDLGTDPRRLALIMSPEELGKVTFVSGDITDPGSVHAALETHGVTNVI